MDNMTRDTLLKKARIEIENGCCKKAYEIMLPLISNNDPEAIFLYSMFSFDHNESEIDFEQRSFDLVTKSATMGYPPAIYTLGTYYDQGEVVEKNEIYAASCFERASSLGHPKAKFEHGLNLFYGSHGILKNPQEALVLINQASEEGVDEAGEFLEKFNHNNLPPN